jgi:hypothetical protein
VNKIENLTALLAALEMLGGFESNVRQPAVIDGYTLVELTDGNMIYDEGVRQHNALIMPQMREMLRNNETTVMSMRDAETDESVLSLSVNSDGIARHVVGKHNAAPSANQLDVLYKLLAAEGLELQYNPFSMY